jgi:DNA-binding response OmpR family regulator
MHLRTPMPTQPVVAVVNTNPDLVELLKVQIEKAGFVVLVIHINDIRQGLDIGAVLEQHDPQVIVYDVVFPYERNWRFLQHLRETTFNGRRFVITTPNEAGVRQLVGRDERVYEVLDDGGDTDAIVQAVREAARARPTT